MYTRRSYRVRICIRGASTRYVYVYVYISAPTGYVSVYIYEALLQGTYRQGGDAKSEAPRKVIGQAPPTLGKNLPPDGFLFHHSRLRHQLQYTAHDMVLGVGGGLGHTL